MPESAAADQPEPRLLPAPVTPHTGHTYSTTTFISRLKAAVTLTADMTTFNFATTTLSTHSSGWKTS